MSTGTCVSFETKRRHSAQFAYTNCQFFLRPAANFFVLPAPAAAGNCPYLPQI
jgi:hypothetical protein